MDSGVTSCREKSPNSHLLCVLNLYVNAVIAEKNPETRPKVWS